MGYQTIKYEVEDQILTITLNRPDKLNAFNGTMQQEMIDAFDARRQATTTSAPSSSPARAARSAPAPTSPPAPTPSTATRGADR